MFRLNGTLKVTSDSCSFKTEVTRCFFVHAGFHVGLAPASSQIANGCLVSPLAIEQRAGGAKLATGVSRGLLPVRSSESVSAKKIWMRLSFGQCKAIVTLLFP